MITFSEQYNLNLIRALYLSIFFSRAKYDLGRADRVVRSFRSSLLTLGLRAKRHDRQHNWFVCLRLAQNAFSPWHHDFILQGLPVYTRCLFKILQQAYPASDSRTNGWSPLMNF